MNKLCTRTVYDESGCPHACLDEYIKAVWKTN
ncbi:helix-turn-helix domain-containing protein [uncultured Oscillibacter sp.]